MGPLRGLWRDTWWLWFIFLAAIIVVAYLVTPFFLFLIPIFVVMFLYFAFVRYDENGRNKGDL
ncbi:hypothetical protein AB1L30_03515 [Bremerella sp. JC817]|uniref:hypothetical protein n=1 Tax=Bremerella sp. JC817 TaxID=3231756 RepID=UPI003458EBA5